MEHTPEKELRNKAVELVALVRSNAERVNKASNERSKFVSELVDRSRSIGSDIADLRKQAAGTQQDLSVTAEATEKVLLEVSAIVEAMDEALNGITYLSDRLSQFEKSFKDVQSVSKSIKDVAERTNILSFNAMIEAANAGEEGLGFTAIANEVRELANQTGGSAESISKTIESLVSDSSVMTRDCAELEKLTGRSVRNSKANLDGLKSIHSSVLESATLAREASMASTSQIGQFAELIDDMDHLQNDTKAAIDGSSLNIDIANQLEKCISDLGKGDPVDG